MAPDNWPTDDDQELTPKRKEKVRKDFLDFLLDDNLGSDNYCLEYLDDFNDDREIMFLLVALNGSYLESASKRLRDDKELVLKALENDTYNAINVKEIGETLKKDRDVALALVKANGSQLFFMPDWQDDEEIVREAVSRVPVVVKVASSRLQKILTSENLKL